jgi:hypothetical protein
MHVGQTQQSAWHSHLPWVLLELCEVPQTGGFCSLISRTGDRSPPSSSQASFCMCRTLHMSTCLRKPHGRHPMQWLLIPHQLIGPEQSRCTCELAASRSLWLPFMQSHKRWWLKAAKTFTIQVGQRQEIISGFSCRGCFSWLNSQESGFTWVLIQKELDHLFDA